MNGGNDGYNVVFVPGSSDNFNDGSGTLTDQAHALVLLMGSGS